MRSHHLLVVQVIVLELLLVHLDHFLPVVFLFLAVTAFLFTVVQLLLSLQHLSLVLYDDLLLLLLGKLLVELLLHRHASFLFLLLAFVVLIIFLILLLLLIDFGNVGSARALISNDLVLLVLLLLIIFFIVLLVLIVAHIFLLLVLLDGLCHHVVANAHARLHLLLLLLVAVVFLLFLIFLFFTHVLLLVFLESHHLVLSLQGLNEFGVLEESCVLGVVGEESGRDIEAVVVLGREEELLLFFGQVGVGVDAGLLQNFDVLLQLTDLSKIPHEGLGDLLNEKRLVSNVEVDVVNLLGPVSFQSDSLFGPL